MPVIWTREHSPTARQGPRRAAPTPGHSIPRPTAQGSVRNDSQNNRAATLTGRIAVPVTITVHLILPETRALAQQATPGSPHCRATQPPRPARRTRAHQPGASAPILLRHRCIPNERPQCRRANAQHMTAERPEHCGQACRHSAHGPPAARSDVRHIAVIDCTGRGEQPPLIAWQAQGHTPRWSIQERKCQRPTLLSCWNQRSGARPHACREPRLSHRA